MIETFNTVRKKYGLRILVVFLSMLFLCTYISRKEGYHMDEILAYQLANAEYNPWIVPTQPVGRLAKFMSEYIEGEYLGETVSNIGFIVKDTLANRGSSILANYKADVYEAPVWISAEMFQDYLRCDTGDDYNLLSVYFNVKDDNHPPLHFMLLHIMSSLFKGEISVWQGCFINLLAVAGVLWLLGLIGDMLFKRKTSTLALMILYGFSMGAVGTAIWIRMYGLLTLWTVWGLYLHLRKYAQVAKKAVGQDSFLRINARTGKPKWIGSIGILIMTLLSFWTQYFGLFFILPLAVVMVILLTRDKRVREMWAYIRTMLTAAVIGVCVYPFAIGDVLFSSRGTEALGQWQKGPGEFVERLVAFGGILGENVAGSGWLFLLVLLVPVVWMLAVRRRDAYNGSGAGIETESLQEKGTEQRGHMIDIKQKVSWWQLAMCGVPTFMYFLLACKMSPYFVDRYIMAIFPISALFIVWLWDCAVVLRTEIRKSRYLCSWRDCIVIAVALILVICQNIRMNGQHEYLYTDYGAQLAVAEEYAQYPCVCLYPGLSFYENVMEMERYAQTMLVKNEELTSMDEERIAVAGEGYIALIKYPGEEAGKEQLSQVMEVFGGESAELLYSGGAYGDAIYLVLF